MALSDQELKEIAYLARISVKEESLPSLKKELEDILGLFKELDEAIEKRINRTYDEILNENPILLNTSNGNSAITTPSSDRSKKHSSKQHLEQEQEEQELVPRFVPWQFVVPLIYVSRLFHFFGIE